MVDIKINAKTPGFTKTHSIFKKKFNQFNF